MAARKFVRKKRVKVRAVGGLNKLDRITKEEILISLVWIAVLAAVGIILNGTRYMTPSLIIIVIGLIASLITLNYNK